MRTKSLLFVACLGLVPVVAAADSSVPSDPEALACRNLLGGQIDAEIGRALQQLRYRQQLMLESQTRDLDSASDKSQRGDGPMLGASSQPKVAAAPRPTAAPEPAPPKEERASRGSAGKADSNKDPAAGPANYSRTNTQEQSVDEGDIVKTNGRLVVHVSCNHEREQSGCRNELRIYSSWPATDSKLLTRYAIPTRGGEPHVEQIYLYGEQLAVLSQAAGRARILVLDLTRPAVPRLLREVELDGAMIESRMIGSRLYLASTTPSFQLPPALIQDIHATVARNSAMSMSVQQVYDAILPRWRTLLERDPGLPQARELTASWDAPTSRPIYRCSDVNAANAVGGDKLLSVIQLDLAERGNISGAGALGYSAQSMLYASEAAFYVADPAAPNGQPWSSATLIRKFSLGRGGKPQFEASALVRGLPLNQFAFSEHQGNLRVATSDNWSSNNLYVLQPEGAQLRLIGSLENLGRNERIFAVRMMGERGYVVTFRRTDPLYTLDLSNPRQPALIGELHIEGYSNYLHPLGNNHLLAVGQDADAWGRPTGLHLQIFDVSDPRQPVRKFHEKLAAGTTSDAQDDHHAFMFEPETNTLSVPWKSQNYWGLLAYRVDPREGFVNLGRVNHALMYKQYFQKQCVRADTAACGQRNYWYDFVTRPAIAVDRIIAIDAQLYSLSPSGMMVHAARAGLPQTKAVLVTPPAWRRTGPAVAWR